MEYYIGFIGIVSFLTFLSYGVDKYKAVHHKHRISEKQLLVLSFFGGALGAITGSVVFRHKSQKLKFSVFNGVFLVLHVLLGVYLFY